MPYDGMPDRFPVLRGYGLTLRELAEEDLPAWFGRLSDPEAAALAGDPVATSMQDAIEGLRHHRNAFRNKEGLRWAIVPDQLGVSVGSIGFRDFDQTQRSAGIGGAIGRAHWNRGIATSAGRLVIDYGFEVLGLACIEAVVLARNGRVIRVLDKLGFERQPEPPVGRGVGGADSESVLYVLRPVSEDAAPPL
jgi:ribosomal-protein-alanine N-acetyltransferase